MNTVNGFQDTIDWYNRHAEEFSQKAGSSEYEVMQKFQQLLPKGGKVLDAGCGDGRDVQLFHDAGFDITGVDLSTGLIDQAKKLHPACKFLVGDIRALAFPEKDFDGIWAAASLVHFETQQDVRTSLKEFQRVLKDKGILYVSAKQQRKDKTAIEYDKRFSEPRFMQYFTVKEMHDFFQEAGFSILSSEIQQSRTRPDIQWIQIIGRKK